MPTIPNTDWMDIDYGDMYDISDFAGEHDSRSTDEVLIGDRFVNPVEDAPACVHCGAVGPFPYEWPMCADCEDKMQSAWEEGMSVQNEIARKQQAIDEFHSMWTSPDDNDWLERRV